MAATTTEIFGSMVFNDHVMKERLPSATYNLCMRRSGAVRRWTWK